MLRLIAILLIGFAFGGATGFVLGNSGNPAPVADVAMEHAGHAHAHGDPLVIEPGPKAPTLALEVVRDPVAGLNLNIQVTGFRFAAENAGLLHAEGEGHAHIYVNGDKFARAYGAWHHIEDVPKGRVEIEVTLNSNDHRALVVGDKPVSATVTFENPG